MKRILVATALVCIGVLASPHAAAAEIKAPKCVTLVDTDGRPIGNITNVFSLGSDFTTAFLEFEGEVLPIVARGDSLMGLLGQNPGTRIAWKSSNCSGTPYIVLAEGLSEPPSDPFVNPHFTMTAVGGSKFIAQVPGSLPEYFEEGSIRDANDLTCYPGTPGLAQAVPARKLFDVSERFHSPFRVSSGPCQ